jgi:hypothetical protein
MKITKWIKRVAAAGLGAGTSLLIACAYGTYYSLDELVNGRVTFGGQGVGGIEVCARVGQNYPHCTTTDFNGRYTIEAADGLVDEAGADGFTLEVNDIDGAENGHYQDQSNPVQPGSMPVTVNVDLTEVTQ